MKRLNQSIISFALFCIIIFLTLFSKEAKSGAIEGINLCENIIIPSLLPILIISNTIININKSPLAAIFFGLISGFPAGAVLTHSLYENKSITSDDAERIMSFNFCGGIAFIISAVGGIIYKSTKAGLILFSSCFLSALIIALFRFPFGSHCNKSEMNKAPGFSDALCKGCESSVKSIALMSAYIILFSAVMKIVKLPPLLVPMLEITNGIGNNALLPPVAFCAFFLSFGGLCIHMQIFSLLNDMKIKYSVFLFYRLLSACLSYIICRIILHFSGDTSLVSASLSPALPFEISKLGSGLSAIMTVGCAVVVFDLENRKVKL